MGVYGGIRGDWRLGLPMLVMSGFSVLASVVGRLAMRKEARRRTEEAMSLYAAVIAERRAELDHMRREQQRIRTAVDPDMEAVLARACGRDPRLWERRPDDADFLCARLGTGCLPSTVTVSATHPDLPDPRLAEAHALEVEYANVPQVPVTVNLRDGPLGIAGPSQERIALARALICHIAAHHAPTEVYLLALHSSEAIAGWRWLRWLPHTHALDNDLAFPTLAADEASACAVCDGLVDELYRRRNQRYALQQDGREPRWPWLVVVAAEVGCVRDDPAIQLLLSPEARHLNATALFLVDEVSDVPAGCQGIGEVAAGGALITSRAGARGGVAVCRSDQADVDLCDRLARSLAPLHVRTMRPDADLPTSVRLLDLLGTEDIAAIDVASRWNPRDSAHALHVPIGLRQGWQPLCLDLKHTGHGPHGLVAGTTGSGKSELLQTLVVALALTHHPHDVGFVLVDFKGGGAFSVLVDLPHVQGLVTDLGPDLAGRALVSLRAEMNRRKRLFSDAGVNDIAAYQQLHRQGRVIEPLPRLVVIVDEFAELVADLPDFIEGLIGVARIGRSLGVHLILATQSPAGVIKQQIWANARFRICLRAESRQESLEMLHRPDAAALPRVPGRGYLQVGNDEIFDLFQVARVAGRYRAKSSIGSESSARVMVSRISPLSRPVGLVSGETEERWKEVEPRSDIELVVERLARAADEMGIDKLPSPWPDPLPAYVALPDLLRRVNRARWDGARWPPARDSDGGPVAVLGLLDDPAHQRQVPLLFDLGQQDGHLIVIGAPGSGKSLWLRTLVIGLAHAYPPDAVQFHLLAFAGSSLRLFESLPHVGVVLAPLDDERVHRLLYCLLGTLDERKRLCSDAGLEGIKALRASRFGASTPSVVVVIDGIAMFRNLFQDEMVRLTRLIREGGPYGLHVVLIGDRAGDIPLAISSVVARRMALRLADAGDYAAVLGASVRLQQNRRLPPGRGLMNHSLLVFQTASPGHARDEGG
jgi:S-DNA-T family DNA segregation ATPase FtsK/SpoIIIE